MKRTQFPGIYTELSSKLFYALNDENNFDIKKVKRWAIDIKWLHTKDKIKIDDILLAIEYLKLHNIKIIKDGFTFRKFFKIVINKAKKHFSNFRKEKEIIIENGVMKMYILGKCFIIKEINENENYIEYVFENETKLKIEKNNRT